MFPLKNPLNSGVNRSNNGLYINFRVRLPCKNQSRYCSEYCNRTRRYGRTPKSLIFVIIFNNAFLLLSCRFRGVWLLGSHDHLACFARGWRLRICSDGRWPSPPTTLLASVSAFGTLLLWLCWSWRRPIIIRSGTWIGLDHPSDKLGVVSDEFQFLVCHWCVWLTKKKDASWSWDDTDNVCITVWSNKMYKIYLYCSWWGSKELEAVELTKRRTKSLMNESEIDWWQSVRKASRVNLVAATDVELDELGAKGRLKTMTTTSWTQI